jgi:hypothetical protein
MTYVAESVEFLVAIFGSNSVEVVATILGFINVLSLFAVLFGTTLLVLQW